MSKLRLNLPVARPAVPVSCTAHTRSTVLSYGGLSLTDDPNFRAGFEPLLPGCTSIPFNDLAALEQALSSRQVAAFIVEPIQGKGVNMPSDEFLPGAAALCRKYGTLFVADEIQTGIGRTGRFLAVEHWNVEPDIGAARQGRCRAATFRLARCSPARASSTRSSIKWIVPSFTDRPSPRTIWRWPPASRRLRVIESEKLIDAAAKRGAELRLALTRMVPGYELLKEVRGKGLMIGVEFGPPKSLRLKASWNVLETASKGLFCQLITVPLFKDHKILTQVSGHGSHTVKLLPRPADHHRRRQQVDRDGVRFRYRLQPQSARRDLVAGQDAGR